MQSVEQMIAIVQIYIHHRKNEEVKISPPTNNRQMLKLIKAYNIATVWLEENGFKQILN